MRFIVRILVVSFFCGCLFAQKPEPFFVEQPALRCNSLDGYSRILIAPQYSISDPSSRAVVESRIISHLEKIGKVVRLPINDVSGLGNAEGILVLNIQSMHTIDGKLLPNSLASLSLYSSGLGINRSCGKIEAWGVQGISNGLIKTNLAEDYLKIIEPLLAQFTKDYLNENREKSPIFYLYTSEKSSSEESK